MSNDTPTLRDGRFHPYSCHACGAEMDSQYSPTTGIGVCPDCSSHYCGACFIWHMMLGHTVDEEINLFTMEITE